MTTFRPLPAPPPNPSQTGHSMDTTPVKTTTRDDTGRARLEVDHLRKAYGTGATSKTVIEDLTFSVDAGEVVCIVGPSGIGKTTLLKCLAGLHPATSGQMRIDGRTISGPPPEMALVFRTTADP